jgi:lactoylglutathione lyase
VIATLAERGVPLFRPLKRGADGNRQAWIEDPDGNRIELMEMAPDGLQARAVQRLRRSGGA